MNYRVLKAQRRISKDLSDAIISVNGSITGLLTILSAVAGKKSLHDKKKLDI